MDTDKQMQAVQALHAALARGEEGQQELWQVVLAWQQVPFFTSSGLPFSYRVKTRKNGDYSGELLISRKEGGKTLTRSSILLALRTVAAGQIPAEYAGPKAIGQIFGISYIYSMFWRWGLIQVPPRLRGRLLGGEKISSSGGIAFFRPLCYNVITEDIDKSADPAGEIR